VHGFGAKRSIGALVAVLALPSVAGASPISTAPAVARGSGGQQTLAVGFDGQGQLRATVCAREPCTLEHATPIAVPEAEARRATTARLSIVGIGLGRRAIVVEIPQAGAESGWAAVVVAPLSGDKPLVPFSGAVGFREGLEGERTGNMVLVSDGVYVGLEKEGSDLCGRRAILSPKALDPATFTLVPAKLQRLTERERDAATSVTATPATGAPPSRLIRPAWATSAAEGAPVSNIADGNADTLWAEGKSGVGRGEFAVLSAPRQVPFASFEVSVGSSGKADHAFVPKEFYLATDHELFKVTLPAEAERAAGRYAITLPAPIFTSCVAVVIESAFGDDKAARVGIGEIAARPPLVTNPAELVDKLAAGGAEAEVAAALIRAGDRPGFEMLSQRFASLDENARRVALDVLDDAPCEVAITAYMDALAGPFEAQRIHARNGFLRCRSAAGPLIPAVLARTPGRARPALVDELATLAPSGLVSAALPLLEKAKVSERRTYRAGLARASAAAETHELFVRALGDPQLGPVTTIDVLRALGDRLPAFRDTGHAAFLRVSGGDASFRNRYLLLGPAAVLAESDNSARAFLRSAIAKDPDPRIRAEAVRSVKDQKLFTAELVRGLDDGAMRVREASAVALGAGKIDASGAALSYRLSQDTWPLVRRAAARALGDLGADRSIDAQLGRATLDESADVRREVLRAIGVRRAVSEVDSVRERFFDKDEQDAVRSMAAISLGRLCDTASLESLTKRARKIATPMSDESDRVIGRGALTALSLIGPSDLKKRLEPFWAKGVPRSITELAVKAVAAPSVCGPARTVSHLRNARR
jgi:HEAT repeat protein